MFYVLIVNDRALAVTDYAPPAVGLPEGVRFETRNDWKSFERVEEIARQLTDSFCGRRSFVATDDGDCCSPRYDVIEPPAIGQYVSKSFNGDSYPEGVITKISRNLRRIETATGTVFWRRRNTGAWINEGTWSLIQGSRSDRNPSF